MSPMQNSLPLQQSAPSNISLVSTQTQHPLVSDTGRIIFTRQLWQRTMPGGSQSEQGVPNKSQTDNPRTSHSNTSGSRKRISSTISLRSHHRSRSSSGDSKTPLTPEESPPFTNTRKRGAGAVEQEDKTIKDSETSPAHTRTSSGDSAVQFCICQPDPKIPRPRNAFILYRQHHQANVVARNPGLANPEISKIIGEQWQNETADQKNKWKALAEEEKIRHQQQYPTYRYQPKRNGRRNSTEISGPGGEKAKCQKCSGRMILTPSAPYSTSQNNSLPQTPCSAITPLTGTLPVFRDLSLDTPAARHLRGSYPVYYMSPNHRDQVEEGDDLGSLSLGSKRRRFHGDPPATVPRVMPPRYGAAPPGASVGPGTPFPYAPSAPPPPAFSQASVNSRRESLPGIRGVVSPQGPMGPPPRPGMGYQQHRLSQGHIPQDRSLTLPPLQTGHSVSISETAGAGQTADEQIMNISFRYKIKVLSQVAPPAAKNMGSLRGPLIAVEGDNPEAVADMAGWLKDRLSKGEDLTVSLFEGPQVSSSGGKEEAMAQYHRLAAEWLGKKKDILDSITFKSASSELSGDAPMTDAVSSTVPPRSSGQIDENDDGGDDSSSSKGATTKQQQESNMENVMPSRANSNASETIPTEKMEIDSKEKRVSIISLNSNVTTSSPTPVTIIPNYSLHTSNLFARLIPIEPNDPYAPNDHWQWTATLWRGIIGPDLTIYLRDAPPGASTRPSVELEGVEGRPGVGLFVVKRVRTEGSEENSNGGEVEAGVLRRVGFEVSEWVRAFSDGRDVREE